MNLCQCLIKISFTLACILVAKKGPLTKKNMHHKKIRRLNDPDVFYRRYNIHYSRSLISKQTDKAK